MRCEKAPVLHPKGRVPGIFPQTCGGLVRPLHVARSRQSGVLPADHTVAREGDLEVLALVDVLELLLDDVHDLVLPLVVPKLLGLLAGDDADGLLVRGSESLSEEATNYPAEN